MGTWFLNDPDPEEGNRIPHGELRRIARSIHQRSEIELTIGINPVRRVRPLGLVLKAGSWNLVVSGRSGVEFTFIDDLRSTRLTTQSLQLLRTSTFKKHGGNAGMAKVGKTRATTNVSKEC